VQEEVNHPKTNPAENEPQRHRGHREKSTQRKIETKKQKQEEDKGWPRTQQGIPDRFPSSAFSAFLIVGFCFSLCCLVSVSSVPLWFVFWEECPG
jgi:hypothetical protein